MASVMRLARFGKIAAFSALGGSFYLLRDKIKPYLGYEAHTQVEPTKEQTKPMFIDNLPEKVPYLLVGGGTASHSAMRAIRGHDPKAKVLIVTNESRSPYMRPALSKDLWFTEKDIRQTLNFKWWNGKERSIYYEIDEFYIPLEDLDKRETGGVSLVRNTRLTRLDPDNRIAHLETGQTIKYDKCLLAPGVKPKTLPELEAAPEELKERIIYFRTADDFLRLEKISESAKTIAIIGGGFLGSELACALSKRAPSENVPKDQVIYQIYPESGNLGKVLPQYLSDWVSGKIEKEGAHLIRGVEVKSVSKSQTGSIEIKLSNGESITTDYIVCAVGLEPDVELAKSSNLEVDEKTGGYLVNSELEARSNVWVAGDASCFYDTKLGRRRVEHHDHANHSGRQAGQNMIGAGQTYSHQSMFWSDLGTEISFEAVGIIDSSLPTVAVFCQPEETDTESDSQIDPKQISGKEEFEKGIVFYLKNDIIVGVLLWNLFGRLSIARRILNEQKKYEDYNEVAKLFNVYLEDLKQ